ncbi:Protein of unknown function (DUF2874) [Bernardetia litoralis DSM 6794]|uniref:Putative beta-lactamase-inhibitor-like PepSY-like domain-containing protein n=1 Tax=Bernardetia litoralis (strain ATCC 23117 / DSM 6794 / NBRC 15988 / NCIMB 1366 / Fx l1 / Sio-4) TaxID=880071 RepID=I4AK43_BERLS|nr:PepSY-like domain-containing protein [Bernardetia litoralis]AFM04328.1 Protein of unknown function (DUF2874) [Bernardetia litoralis DSM 6794]
MKKTILTFVTGLFLVASSSFAQDIPQSQVPSLVINNFQMAFPKVYDIEWEMDGNLYKVEFEKGLFSKDYDIWYDQTGKIIRQKEDISNSDLPQAITSTIKSQFGGYRIDEAQKNTEGQTITYKVELENFSQEWKVIFDANGKIIQKIAD